MCVCNIYVIYIYISYIYICDIYIYISIYIPHCIPMRFPSPNPPSTSRRHPQRPRHLLGVGFRRTACTACTAEPAGAPRCGEARRRVAMAWGGWRVSLRKELSSCNQAWQIIHLQIYNIYIYIYIKMYS